MSEHEQDKKEKQDKEVDDLDAKEDPKGGGKPGSGGGIGKLPPILPPAP